MNKRLWIVGVSFLAYVFLLEYFYHQSFNEIKPLGSTYRIGGNTDSFERFLVSHFFPSVEELFSIPGGKAYFVLRSRLSPSDSDIRRQYFLLTTTHYLNVAGTGQFYLENPQDE